MSKILETDDYHASLRFRVAKRADGHYEVFDTNENRGSGVYRYFVDALIACGEANEKIVGGDQLETEFT